MEAAGGGWVTLGHIHAWQLHAAGEDPAGFGPLHIAKFLRNDVCTLPRLIRLTEHHILSKDCLHIYGKYGIDFSAVGCSIPWLHPVS